MSTPDRWMTLFRAARVGLSAWLLPGLGHWFLGKRDRAVFYGSIIGACYLIGLLVSEGTCVHKFDHPYSNYAQLGVGGPTLLFNRFAKRSKPLPPGYRASGIVVRDFVPGLDLGLLYTSVAGVLNLLVAADAFDRARTT